MRAFLHSTARRGAQPDTFAVFGSRKLHLRNVDPPAGVKNEALQIPSRNSARSSPTNSSVAETTKAHICFLYCDDCRRTRCYLGQGSTPRSPGPLL